MTINYVKRYSDNLNIKNEITDFNRFHLVTDDIVAVSWEAPGYSRREYSEEILKNIYYSITQNTKGNIHLMVQLSSEQPNNSIVKHKKTWGLIESSGVNTDKIFDKKSFTDNGREGLILTGSGFIPITSSGIIKKLANTESKLFFSNLPPDENITGDTRNTRLTQWVNNILRNNGIILFPLGFFDEKNAELVAVGSKLALKRVI